VPAGAGPLGVLAGQPGQYRRGRRVAQGQPGPGLEGLSLQATVLVDSPVVGESPVRRPGRHRRRSAGPSPPPAGGGRGDRAGGTRSAGAGPGL